MTTETEIMVKTETLDNRIAYIGGKMEALKNIFKKHCMLKYFILCLSPMPEIQCQYCADTSKLNCLKHKTVALQTPLA